MHKCCNITYSPEAEIGNKSNAMTRVFSFWIVGLGACTASEASVGGTVRCLHGASHTFKPFQQPILVFFGWLDFYYFFFNKLNQVVLKRDIKSLVG